MSDRQGLPPLSFVQSVKFGWTWQVSKFYRDVSEWEISERTHSSNVVRITFFFRYFRRGNNVFCPSRPKSFCGQPETNLQRDTDTSVVAERLGSQSMFPRKPKLFCWAVVALKISEAPDLVSLRRRFKKSAQMKNLCVFRQI